MKQAQAKMAKIREGFEGGLYGLDEAKRRIDEYQGSVDSAEEQIRRLQKEMGAPDITAADLEALKQELSRLRTKNLDAAPFDEKREIVTRLGMKVYPSEDLKSVRIACGANFTFRGDGQSDGGDCRKVVVGPPFYLQRLLGAAKLPAPGMAHN